jgi:hypothetical protein
MPVLNELVSTVLVLVCQLAIDRVFKRQPPETVPRISYTRIS